MLADGLAIAGSPGALARLGPVPLARGLFVMAKEGLGLRWYPSQWRQREWFLRVYSRGQLHDSFCEILHGTEEWRAWAAYFDSLRWRPVTFGMREPSDVLPGGGFRLRVKSWTAPCRWPGDLEGRS